MKRYNVLLLIGLVLVAIQPAAAQTYEDAVNAFNQGVELVGNNNHSGAIQAFEKVITISTSLGEEGAEIKKKAEAQIPSLYFNISMTLARANQLLDAAASFEKTIAEAQKYGNESVVTRAQQVLPQIYYNAGIADFRNGNFESAQELFDKAILIQPSYAVAYYQKGLTYIRMEQLETALNQFDRAIQIAEATNNRQVVDNATNAARNNLLLAGANAKDARQYRRAIELYRMGLEYDSSFAELYFRLAEVYNIQAQWDNTIQNANFALQYETGGRNDRAKIWFELGIAHKNKGNKAAACEAFRNAAVGNFRAAADHEIEHELKCNVN